MISRGDESAKNAFRAGLRDDTPLPANVTQELDPLDILAIEDVDAAIARAEESNPALLRPRPRDPFDVLAEGRPTDDASGPALHAAVGTPTPLLPKPIPPAPRTQPMIDASEDAYYHPGGRVRSLADVTLDGYRPELARAAAIHLRRKRFAWIVAGVLVPLAVLAVVGAALTRGRDATAATEPATATATATPAAATPVQAPAPVETTPPKPAPVETAAAAPQAAPPKSDVPVFDVKSLPTAKRRHHK